MCNRTELKEIILKKWVFPDFSNKLTWFVVGVGAAVVLTPTPFKQLFYNWLVDTFNLNSGSHYTLVELQSDSADYWLGFSLIFLALLHNAINQIFVYKTEIASRVENESKHAIDRVLIQEFMELLPSDGPDMEFLEEHDFFTSHHGKSWSALNRYVSTWDVPEKNFLDPSLEEKRLNFYNKSKQFMDLLAVNSYSIKDGTYYSCVPDLYRGTRDCPEHVRETIKEINRLGTECFDLHRVLVSDARRKLKF